MRRPKPFCRFLGHGVLRRLGTRGVCDPGLFERRGLDMDQMTARRSTVVLASKRGRSRRLRCAIQRALTTHKTCIVN
jgi:hypothetical protein